MIEVIVLSEKVVCPVCGEQTYMVYGKYPRKDKLCGKHATMLRDGDLFLTENGSYWFRTSPTFSSNVDETDNVQKSDEENSDTCCVVCGENSSGKPQCKNCYYETKDFIEILDKNTSVRKTRDYYYNLKERILIIKSISEAQKQCNKLIAIAMIGDTYNDDSSLIDRVYKDVETLIKGKQTPLENPKFEEERKEQDEHKSKINTAEDGHNVDSDMEVRIDDVLYHARILHSYGKNIDEITEKRKKCDWFIPILNDEGIYIEYWGMKTQKYLEERKEKEELYKKYNIPYIGIEADDPKQDSQTFKSNLIRDLTNLSLERYGFMPRWKK